jgi:hypothetical protein
MPVCDKCGKESHNLRMCPFCFAEYSQPRGGARQSTGFALSNSALALKLSPPVRWGLLAVIVLLGGWYFFLGRERTIPTGVVVANLVAAPMSRGEAEALLRRVKAEATVEDRGGSLRVSFPAALWPERRAGQLAAAQQYARAVDVVEGRKRDISFFDPSGTLYAKATAEGVVMVK